MKIMITKGKQKLELQECLNILKDMSQRLFKQKQMSSSNASTSSVGQAISPEEEMIVTHSNEKILRIVMDQWIIYTHYKVKHQI